MRQITTMFWLLLATPFASVAQTTAKTSPPAKTTAAVAVRCKGADGRPCTSAQLDWLTNAVVAEKKNHDVLLPVKNLELAAPDGSVKCTQNDGSACTTAELDEIKQLAQDRKLYLNYRSTPAKSKL